MGLRWVLESGWLDRSAGQKGIAMHYDPTDGDGFNPAATPTSPVAWGRVIDGKAVTVSRDWTAANDEPLYAAPPSPSFDRTTVIEECATAAECTSPPDWSPEGMRHQIAKNIRALCTVTRPDGGAA